MLLKIRKKQKETDMATFYEDFKKELLDYDKHHNVSIKSLDGNYKGSISNFVLLVKFKNCTKSGDGLYYLTLLYNNGGLINRFNDVSSLLLKFKNKTTIKQNKKGYVIGYSQLHDYLNYHVNELQQIRL